MAFIGNTNTTQAFTPAIDYFSGNGSTTAFTLSRPVASVAQVQVTIDNVAQNPSSAYTVSANTITFTSAPLSGTNNIYVYYTSPITQVIAPGQGTVNTTALGNITNIASGNSSLTLQTGSGNTTAVTVDTSQNVGIGTSSPSYKLDVQGTTANQRISSTTGTNAAYQIFSNTGQNFYVGLDNSAGNQLLSAAYGATLLGTGAYPMVFGTNNAERMRIDSSGNLLVGQTAQTGTEKFGVTQSATGSNAARFYASSTSFVNNIVEISCARSGATTEYNAFTVFDNNTTLKMLIRPNGNLLNANNSYGSLSDVSLKENIVDATPKLDGLMQVKVRNYNLKDDVNKTKQIGVIAQELETVFPSMIEEDKDGIKSVKYSVFVPMLVKAIQELKAINDTQAETINALTARIVALESR